MNWQYIIGIGGVLLALNSFVYIWMRNRGNDRQIKTEAAIVAAQRLATMESRIAASEEKQKELSAEVKTSREKELLLQWVKIMHDSPLNRDTQLELDDLLDRAQEQVRVDAVGIDREYLSEEQEVRIKNLLLERLNDPAEDAAYKKIVAQFLLWVGLRQSKRLSIPTAISQVQVNTPINANTSVTESPAPGEKHG